MNNLREHLTAGIIREQKHDRLPLSIFNYSERCQYERLWDETTLQCRGLVLHGDIVVARPFRKFFNESEHQPDEIPWHLPCEVTEKMDGSLLIWFCFEGEWIAATRGSFESLQAKAGHEIIQERYPNHRFDPSLTYLWEVIYPENRIVVNYGALRDVVLLGIVETASGRELPLDSCGVLNCVRRLPPSAPVRELRSLIRDDEEGYVVRFENGFRIKVKGQRYMELHRLMCGVSSRSIWEHLSQGQPLDDLLSVVPDEFANWLRREQASQLAAFDFLNRRTAAAHLAVKHLATRKEQAAEILTNFRDVSAAAFAMLDGKPTADLLWKQLYPEYRRPVGFEEATE